MQVTGYMWDELSKILFCLLFSPQIKKQQGSQAESEDAGRDDRSLRKTRNGMVMYKTGMNGVRTIQYIQYMGSNHDFWAQ